MAINKMEITIQDGATGESITRPMTDEEIALHNQISQDFLSLNGNQVNLETTQE